MASQAKNVPLNNEIDLALAVTAPRAEKERLLRAALRKGGYRYYRGIRSAAPMILRVASGLLPSPSGTKAQAKALIKSTCINVHGELDNNLHLGEGLYDYAVAHNVTGAELNIDPVSLGRAGRRFFWERFILKIDGKKYIPFIDPRLPNKGLTPDARQLVFSIQHTHFTLADPTVWGDVGFVIFQFEESKKGCRKVIPHFGDGIKFWDDRQIARMIDDTYRLMDDIRRAA
jgi:hypothetical protein